MKPCLPVAFGLTLSTQAPGQTFYVDGACGDDAWTGASPTCAAPDGPKRTITAAIPPSGSATIHVAPGIYTEQINIVRFSQPPWMISIESENGPASTVIEGTGQPGSTVVSANSIGGNNSGLNLRGFTLRHADVGVALSISQFVTNVVQDCVFTDLQTGISVRMPIRISNCTFHDNSGDAVHLVPGFQASAELDHCIFLNNAGSGVTAQRASATIANSLVALNASGLAGLEGGVLTLKNVTVVSNAGTGIYAAGRPDFHLPPHLIVHNSIICGNNGGGEQITVFQGSAPPPVLDIQYSIVQGGFAGTANLNVDPLFVDPAGGDFHLGAGSPGIDSGNAFLVPFSQAVDLEGQPRIADDPATVNSGAPFPTYVDRGAYETIGRPYCIGDTGDDHDVDLVDLSLLLSQFGTTGTALWGDQNRNGSVDLEDLTLLLSNFGNACP